MAVLQIRELPEHIYERLKADAEREHRSLSQQAIAVLEGALAAHGAPQARRRDLIRAILESDAPDVKLDPTLLVRTDRKR